MDTFEQKCLAEQKLGMALERLQNNADFQLAIQKAFLQDEALMSLHNSTDPLYTKEVQADFLARAHGTSVLHSWIGNTIRLGKDAPNQLAAYQERMEAVARMQEEDAGYE